MDVTAAAASGSTDAVLARASWLDRLVMADETAQGPDQGDGQAEANAGIAAATVAVAAVTHTSTWPWRPQTFRGFLSALGLPVLVWLITRFIGRAILG
jgi:hypothetical protein